MNERDQLLTQFEMVDRYYVDVVYNETENRVRLRYRINPRLYSKATLIIADSHVQHIAVQENYPKLNPIYLDESLSGDSCSIDVKMILTTSKEKEISVHMKQICRLPVSLKKQISAYETLYKELETLPFYKDYQKLFFEIEKRLREAIGMLHYKANHVTDDQTEQKLFARIASTIEVSVFNSVYHAGFDMATGKPFSPSVPDGFAPTLKINDLNLVMQEIVKLQKEIDRRKDQRRYYDFWVALYPILHPFWQNENENEDALPATVEELSSVVHQFEQLIFMAGFRLKYYEDYEDRECMDAKNYLIEGKYGFPALHDSEGALVTNCEGRRDHN